MVVRVLDHVQRCYTWNDGAVIGALLRDAFSRNETVTLSFTGVHDVPSSFVNAAFISLLKDYSFDYIRQHLKIVDSTTQINDMIRRRFRHEVRHDTDAA